MNKQHGFTLIELLIVISIMAIMMAFAAPSMIQWREGARIKGVASDILSGLRQARSSAITTNQDVTAAIDVGNNQLTINGTTRELSTNVSLRTSVDDTPYNWLEVDDSVIFRPNGSCDTEFYIRVNGDNNLIIAIDSTASGLARL